MKLKKVLACLIVGTLIASVPVGVLAKDYTAASVDDIYEAIADQTNEDGIYNITLETGTYDFGKKESQEVLRLVEGKTYSIQGTQCTLLDVNITGNGTITITADIKNDSADTALTVGTGDGDLSVTVNGNVTAASKTDDQGNEISSGINTWNFTSVEGNGSGTTTVTVNGDVTSAGNGVNAHDDSTATITGTVTAGQTGVNSNADSRVTVGSIVSTGNGVEAREGSTVTVKGTINAGDTTNSEDGSAGVLTDYAYNENGEKQEDTSKATVIVEGGVTATGDAVVGQGASSITVKSDVASKNGAGVRAMGGSSIEIVGNITSGGAGIYADYDERDANGNVVEGASKPTGTVTVRGNVTSTNDAVTATGTETVTVTGSVKSTEGGGVNAGEKSNVTTGAVTSAGPGVYVSGDATVTINGAINATAILVYDENGDPVCNDEGEQDTTWAAGVYTEENSNAKVTVNGAVNATTDAVTGQGTSTIKVTGNVNSTDADGVYALGGSSIEIIGNVSGGYDGVHTDYSEWDEEDNPVASSASKATVTVTGNVSGNNAGIDADGSSKVTVTGNVTGNDNEYGGGNGLLVSDKATVTVTGDVTAGDGYVYGGCGIYVNPYWRDSFSGNVTVNGNVSGGDAIGEGTEDETPEAGTGIGIIAYTSGTASVTVNGNVSGGDASAEDAESGYGIFYNNYYDKDDVSIPNITVQSLSSGAGLTSLTSAGKYDTASSKYVTDTALAALLEDSYEKYTVKTEDATGGTVTLDKASYKAGDTVVITPAASDGYEFTGITVTTADGTKKLAYTVKDGKYYATMPTDGTGMAVKAEFKATASTSDTTTTDSKVSSPKTSDGQLAGLWAALGGAAGVAAVAASRKKRNA